MRVNGSVGLMRAAVARDGVLRIDDVDDPVPGAGEGLAAVKAAGICASTLPARVYADELMPAAQEAGGPLIFDPSRDYIMGHEFTAEVVERGPDTAGTPVQPGDVVI